jgi:hypothetical protein
MRGSEVHPGAIVDRIGGAVAREAGLQAIQARASSALAARDRGHVEPATSRARGSLVNAAPTNRSSPRGRRRASK